MNCKKCGKEISNEAYRCPECGEPTEKYLEYAENPKKGMAKETAMEILKIGGAAIVVIAIVFGIVKIAFDKKSTTPAISNGESKTVSSSETSSKSDKFGLEETSTTETTTKASGNVISSDNQLNYVQEGIALDAYEYEEERKEINDIKINFKTKKLYNNGIKDKDNPHYACVTVKDYHVYEVSYKAYYLDENNQKHYDVDYSSGRKTLKLEATYTIEYGKNAEPEYFSSVCPPARLCFNNDKNDYFNYQVNFKLSEHTYDNYHNESSATFVYKRTEIICDIGKIDEDGNFYLPDFEGTLRGKLTSIDIYEED